MLSRQLDRRYKWSIARSEFAHIKTHGMAISQTTNKAREGEAWVGFNKGWYAAIETSFHAVIDLASLISKAPDGVLKDFSLAHLLANFAKSVLKQLHLAFLVRSSPFHCLLKIDWERYNFVGVVLALVTGLWREDCRCGGSACWSPRRLCICLAAGSEQCVLLQ